MIIQIFQIDIKSRAKFLFMNYEWFQQNGGIPLDKSIYTQVFSGDLKCSSLDEIYRIFNIQYPEGYRGRSLSVSDVVSVSGSKKLEPGLYFCDSFGWKPCQWNETRSKKMYFPDKNIVQQLRNDFPIGTRVVLEKMDDFQAPPVGTAGTVLGVDDAGSIMVHWDNGCGLSVAYGEDLCRKVNEGTANE